MTNYYEIIGVPRTASAAEVRSAYSKLARERHPDRFADTVEKARADLVSAYTALGKPEAAARFGAEQQASATPSARVSK